MFFRVIHIQTTKNMEPSQVGVERQFRIVRRVLLDNLSLLKPRGVNSKVLLTPMKGGVGEQIGGVRSFSCTKWRIVVVQNFKHFEFCA